MNERRYKPMLSREQEAWLPECLDDYVGADNAVRVIEAWVESLQLEELGYEPSQERSGLGQPAYPPKMMVKLYMYGYQHRICSSRRLEAELGRNVELMWLCQGATPCYKTIANFRKDNLKLLKAAQSKFLVLCRELSLIGGWQVAIDGTYLKADANPSRMHTEKKLQKELQERQERIEGYYRQLEEQDANEAEAEELSEVSDLKSKLEFWLKRQEEKSS